MVEFHINIAKLVSFPEFEREANGKIIPFSEECSDRKICRSLKEVLYIAHFRIERLKELSKGLGKVHISSVKPNLSEGQVSKILISAPNLIESKTNSVNVAPLFKYNYLKIEYVYQHLEKKCHIYHSCVHS